MQITKEIFDQIMPGEIFWIVTTRLQTVADPMNTPLTFVCVKAKEGHEGRVLWAIYSGHEGSQSYDIARYGIKVRNQEEIRSICPCDDEVFQLYRY